MKFHCVFKGGCNTRVSKNGDYCQKHKPWVRAGDKVKALKSGRSIQEGCVYTVKSRNATGRASLKEIGGAYSSEWIEVVNSNLSLEADSVSNPSHYTAGGIECIDAIEAALTEAEASGFRKGNAIKYIWRAGLKDPNKYVEDLEKAKWYLDREIAKHD